MSKQDLNKVRHLKKQNSELLALVDALIDNAVVQMQGHKRIGYVVTVEDLHRLDAALAEARRPA